MNAIRGCRLSPGVARGLSIVGGFIITGALNGCANFGGDPGRARLNDDFSYYEPFDNSGETGPAYLVGPPPPARSDGVNHRVSIPDKVPPSDKSLPPTCLTCD
jgi:hypothetical protein